MKLAEFFVSLVFDANKKDVDAFGGALNSLEKDLGRLKFAAVAYAINKFVDSTVQAVTALSNFNAQTDLSIEKLQRWQASGMLSNIALSADEVTSSIQALESNLAQIRLGGGNVSPFQLLGIDVAGQDAFQVLESVRSAIQGLDSATATNLIQQMGINPAFINALRMTREEFEGLTDEIFLTSEKRKSVLELGTAITHLGMKFVQLKDQVVAFVAPVLTKLTDGISWLIGNFVGLVDAIDTTTPAFKVLAGSLALVMVAIAPLTSLFIAMLLILEDVATFFQGGDSMTGRFIKGIEKMIDKVVGLRKAMNDAISDSIVEKMVQIANLFNSTKEFINSDPIGRGINSLQSGLSNTFNNVYNIFSGGDSKDIAEEITKKQQTDLNYTLDGLNNGALN